MSQEVIAILARKFGLFVETIEPLVVFLRLTVPGVCMIIKIFSLTSKRTATGKEEYVLSNAFLWAPGFSEELWKFYVKGRF